MTFPSVPRAIVVRTRGGITPIGETPQSRMMLYPEEGQGRPVLIPYAPVSVVYGSFAGEFTTLNRPGLVDALLYIRPKLKTLSFSLLLIDRKLRSAGGQIITNIEALAINTQLMQYAAAGTKLRMAYSSLEAGSWRITDYSPQSVLRDENDEVTQLMVDIELTQAVDAMISSGPVSGGGSGGKSTTPPPANSAPASTKTYVVVQGDTLWAIALDYYGDGSRWTEIADANNIVDPRLLQAGTVLKIS